MQNDTAVPTDVEHQSKPEIALELIEQVVSTEIKDGCAVADRYFSETRSFKRKLRGLSEPSVLEVSPTEFRVVPGDADLIQPDEQPNLKHAAHPEDVTSETPAEVAESFAADMGYDKQSLRESLRDLDIRRLIKLRIFAPYDHAHNARIDK